LIFSFAGRIINLAVLGGKVAVSCNPQSAPAGLNSFPRPFVMQGLPSARSEDVWVLRNGAPRTMSGPEGSSIKWVPPCAAGQPKPSQRQE